MPKQALCSIFLILLMFVLACSPKSGLAVESQARPNLHKASDPECSAVGPIAGVAGVVALGVGTGEIIGGAALLSTGVLAKFGKFLIGTGTITILSTAYAGTIVALYLACRYSFVRHPVLYFKDTGEYKKCANPVKNTYVPEGQETQDFCIDYKYTRADSYQWPKHSTSSSDYIEFCYRGILGHLGSDRTIDPREEEIDKKYPSKWQTSVLTNIKLLGGDLTCVRMKSGDKKKFGGVYFQATEDGDKICIYTYGFNEDAPYWPSLKVGCHLREPSPPAPMCKGSIPIFGDDGEIKNYDNKGCFSCFISEACYSQTGLVAKAQMPMTSLVVQCIRESLRNVLVGDCIDKVTLEPQGSIIGTAQKRLKDTVKAVILLAVILFAFKMMMGAIQSPSEYLMLLIKISFVMYIGIGDGIAFYYDQITNLSVALSDLVLSAGGNQTVCNFSSDDYMAPILKKDVGTLETWETTALKKIYKAGMFREFKDIQSNRASFSELSDQQLDQLLSKMEFKSFDYIAPWDRLDCRLMFYLGSTIKSFSGAGIFALAAIMPLPIVFILITAVFFGGNMILAICAIFFMIMIILTILWMVHLFLISLLAISILAMFAPIFAPMMLFQATKGFFDGWLKEIMAYSFYPVVLFTFMSLVFSVFDVLYFGNLKFKPHVVTDAENTRTTYAYTIDPEDQCDSNEGQTTIACLIEGAKFYSKPLILGINVTATEDKFDSSGLIWKGFLKMALMGFLFYHFLGLIGGLAAELSGSFRADASQGSKSPAEMASKLASVAKKAAGAAKKGVDKAKDFASGKGSSDKDKASEGDSKRSSGSEGSSGSGGDGGS